MLGTALISLLLLGDATDQEFLLRRARDLAERYERFSRSQADPAVSARLAVVRELRHLPFSGEARAEAGRLLAKAVTHDRAYRVRADAACAIGRVGTKRAYEAMYRALFGGAGRQRRSLLMHFVLPEALAGLRHANDMEWVSLRILRPAARGAAPPLFREAGALREAMVVLTLEGVGLARARTLGPDVVALAKAASPRVRAAAIAALVEMNYPHEAIEKALSDSSALVRAAAAAFPGLPVQLAADAGTDRALPVRRAAVDGYAAREPIDGIPLLIRRLAAENDEVLQLDIAEVLNRFTGKEFGVDHGLWRAWWNANRKQFELGGKPDDSGRTYFFELGMRTRRVVFLIDVSASMSREDERRISRLEYAARELSRAIDKLPANARFRVFGFAAAIRRFPEKGAGDKFDAADAGRWLRSLKPAGSTNTYGALMEALHDPFRPDAIVLLSDGNPYRCSWRGKNFDEHEQILAEVRRVNGAAVKIHTVALLSGAVMASDNEDAGAASEFLRRLAARNRGEFREIR